MPSWGPLRRRAPCLQSTCRRHCDGAPEPIGGCRWTSSGICRGFVTPTAQAILGLLRASLSEIAAAWERGSLQEEALTGDEVQRLVQALFEASDARQRVLALVAS